MEDSFQYLDSVLDQWTEEMPVKKSKLTLVHNDFNPRNVGVRLDGRLCIYDWELASYNIPQRDVFEFLAFTLVEDFTSSELESVLKQHFHLMKEWNDTTYSYQDYLDDFKIAGDEFLLTRVSFYLAGSTLVHYPFINRVFAVALKMIQSI
jgi:hydroxymethylglutaryl-CoA reductase (NADPH)